MDAQRGLGARQSAQRSVSCQLVFSPCSLARSLARSFGRTTACCLHSSLRGRTIAAARLLEDLLELPLDALLLVHIGEVERGEERSVSSREM
jgi:hypothetical protein